MSELPLPRDPKMLLSEMSARIKIKDIKQMYELRDRVGVKWYEAGLVGLLFAASLAFLAIIVKLIPESQPMVRGFVVGSSILLIVIVTAILEFLLSKFRALRKLYELHSRLSEAFDKDLDKMQRELAALRERIADEEDEQDNGAAVSPDDSAR